MGASGYLYAMFGSPLTCHLAKTRYLPFIGTRPERLNQAVATTNLRKHLNGDAATAIVILLTNMEQI